MNELDGIPRKATRLRSPHGGLLGVKQRVEEDYLAMRPWLPETVMDLLDIGCGHYPIIDICLSRHYGDSLAIHLMDGDEAIAGKGDKFHSYKKPYNSRHIALAYLKEQLPGVRIYEHPADPLLTIWADLIISRRAWGHHFPIVTYIELVTRSLREGGRVITDIRYGTTGVAVLERYGFRVITNSLEVRSPKCQRIVLERAHE